MVNTGRPSKGCLTCRKRRVKCDEAKPVCNRCTKLQSKCQWQDEWSSIVRRQESWAQKRVAERVERVQLLRYERDSREGTASYAFTKQPYTFFVVKQPQIRPEVYATDRFYLDYAFAAHTCPFLYRVQPLYDSLSTPSCLHSAIPAVSLASAAKCLNRHDLMREADAKYGNTLRKLSQNLADPNAAKSDATLLTVFLLGLFEAISLDRHPGRRPPWEIHGTGRLAILRLRGLEQLSTQSGRNLFVILYQEHLISCFLGNSDLLDECIIWMRATFPPSPIVAMMLLMHDVCAYLKKLKNAYRKEKPSIQKIQNFLNEGKKWHDMSKDLLQVFQSGEAADSATLRHYTGPKGWVPEQTTLTKRSRHLSQPEESSHAPVKLDDAGEKSKTTALESDGMSIVPSDEIKKYLSVTGALGTNFLRAAYMFLLEGLLAAMDFLKSQEPSTYSYAALGEHDSKYNMMMKQLAIQICDDIPFSLGYRDHEGKKVEDPVGGLAFRAYLSLWPMQTALKAAQTPLRYRKLLLMQLKHIGQDIGIGMAFNMLSQDGISQDDLGNEEGGLEPESSQRSVLRVDGALNDHVSWAISQTR